MINALPNNVDTYAGNIMKETNCSDKINSEKIEGDKTEGISGYYEKLCKKFPSLKISVNNYVVKPGPYSPKAYSNGSNSIWGNVNLNYEYLEKAASDPKIAADLENKLSGIPQAEVWVRNHCAQENTELLDFGWGIGADGEFNSYSQMRMPATKSNYSTENKNVIKKIQDKNKEYVRNKEMKNKNKETKRSDVLDEKPNIDAYAIWEKEHLSKEALKEADEAKRFNEEIYEKKYEADITHRQYVSEAYEKNIIEKN